MAELCASFEFRQVPTRKSDGEARYDAWFDGYGGILPVHGLECPTVPKVLVFDSFSNGTHACDGYANTLEKCDCI